MTITRENIFARKEELLKQRDQLVANVGAYNGAIEDCDYWLQVLEKEAEVKEPTAVNE